MTITNILLMALVIGIAIFVVYYYIKKKKEEKAAGKGKDKKEDK